MDLYSPIFSRKSVRKFSMSPVDPAVLQGLDKVIADTAPLLPGAKFRYKIVGPDDVKGLGICTAPHYLMISGGEQPLRNTCAGYLFQHAELYLYASGLATRWLNGVKCKTGDPDHIIGIAFGAPAEPATRKPEEFERKPLAEIARGTDERLEAARLAPSGMNGQPWYFIVQGDAIHVYYRPRLAGLMGRLYNKTDLDAGIALCHLQVASDHFGKPFHFTTGRKDAPAAPEGFAYLGTVE